MKTSSFLATLLAVSPLDALTASHGSARDDVKSSSLSASAITPEITALAESLLADYHVPGISVGVVRLNGSSVITEYNSWGNRTEDGDPADPHMITGLGSCSKAFLTSAIGILIDDFANGLNVTALPEGLDTISWDTKIQALFPGDSVWKLEDEWATEKASIADMLSMATGITSNQFVYTRDDNPVTLAQRFRYIKPGFELRERWEYTNIFYFFAAQIVTAYSGKTFQEFVKERIFDPLNMTSTTYSTQEANVTGHLSQSWAYIGRRIPIIIDDPATANLIAGGGGVLSNAVDMGKWAATVLNGGVDPVTNKTVIPASAYDETTTARIIQAGNVTNDKTTSIIGYGLGWQRNSFMGHDIITHDGSIPGFVASLMVLPDDNLAVFALLNTDAPFQDVLPKAIISSVLGLNATSTSSPSTKAVSRRTLSARATSLSGNCTQSSTALEKFAGDYTSPAYGNLTFCAPTTVNVSESAPCNGTLSDFASLGALDPNTLYATTNRIATHLSMQRTCDGSDNDSAFVVTFQSIYPNGYGRNTTAFAEAFSSTLPDTHVECVVDDGNVAGCGWLDVEVSPIKSVGTVQDRAQIWWTRQG
ncbi:beta-lactamase/transpeptidase-like protein [Ganoderma leucocontextum]|nr:beta-lactamase/transpeptidase-like protein [Ganoderma leucocontextum]